MGRPSALRIDASVTTRPDATVAAGTSAEAAPHATVAHAAGPSATAASGTAGSAACTDTACEELWTIRVGGRVVPIAEGTWLLPEPN
jgi:hypothetical protein